MKMAFPLRIVLLVGFLCALPSVTNAQTLPEEQQAAGWIFTPAIRFGGSWDNNILLANEGDNPPGDYATPLSPAADLEYRGRRTRLSSGYEGAFLWYRTFEELNSTEQHIRARLEHRVTPRVTLFGLEEFSQVPTTDALLLAGVPFYRVGSQMNQAGGGVEARLTRSVTLRGRYSLNYVDFADDSPAGSDLQGGHAHEFVVGVDRTITQRLTFTVEFEAQRAVLTGGLDHFDTNTIGAGLEYDLTPTLTVSGLAGVSRLGAGLDHDAQMGPALRAAISQRVRHLVLSASYSRSYIPSFGFGGTFQNVEWQGNVHIPFHGTRGYIDGSVAHFDNEPLEPTQANLRTFWLTGTLGFRLTRWLSAEGYYGHSQQNSQRPGSDLGRHLVGFRMLAAKPVRLAK